MSAMLSLNTLLEYTEWERGKWSDWMHQQDPHLLQISAGPHGDGRFETVGEVIRHVFAAEKRYVDRLSGRPVTDVAAISVADVDALFAFGTQSRRELKTYIDAITDARWDVPVQMKLMNNVVTATPRKIIIHVLMHEIRHWAQIATILRLNGMKVEFHDFIFSPVMGGELRRESESA